MEKEPFTGFGILRPAKAQRLSGELNPAPSSSARRHLIGARSFLGLDGVFPSVRRCFRDAYPAGILFAAGPQDASNAGREILKNNGGVRRVLRVFGTSG